MRFLQLWHLRHLGLRFLLLVLGSAVLSELRECVERGRVGSAEVEVYRNPLAKYLSVKIIVSQGSSSGYGCDVDRIRGQG
jgi:hypothetical protein